MANPCRAEAGAGEAGMRSIEQEAIARWPHSVDIDLGAL